MKSEFFEFFAKFGKSAEEFKEFKGREEFKEFEECEEFRAPAHRIAKTGGGSEPHRPPRWYLKSKVPVVSKLNLANGH